MTVDAKLAFIFSFFHGSGDHAHHPDNAKDVVGVLMGDENVVDMSHDPHSSLSRMPKIPFPPPASTIKNSFPSFMAKQVL